MSSPEESVAIGIDLGTTHCCVAYMNNRNVVDIIANDIGSRTTPSYIVLTGQGILIGEIAKREYFIPPSNVVYDSKRLIGRKFNDKYIQGDLKNWTFKVKDSENQPIIELSLENEPVCYKPQEISAMLLEYMKKIAEAYIGKSVKDAIITVPAHFNYYQRTATVEAGRLAGLNVLGTINEPTAAALAYVHKNDITDDRTILVYDLGGGTFDVSIVKVTTNTVKVLATAGNTHLGGRDFDNNLIELILKKIREQFGEDFQNSATTKRRVKAASENIKINLTSTLTTHLDLPSIHNGEDVLFEISREEFEEVNSELFLLTLDIIKNCLNDAKLNKSDIDDIVLVGGSTRIPKIQQLLSKFFNGKALSKAINADEAIAYGAAVQTAKFNNSVKSEAPVSVSDITPLSLGVNTHGCLMSVLIPRNATIPTTATKTYSCVCDKHTIRQWNIYEGERGVSNGNILLGKCTLKTKPHPPGYPVDLIFEIDENGILHVSARDKSGYHTKMTINYYERDSINVNDIIQDANEIKPLDSKIRNVTKDWILLRNYCTKLKALCNYNNKFNIGSADKETILTIANEVYKWAKINFVVSGTAEELTAIKEKLDQVDDICQPLATRYGFNVKNMGWEEFYELVADAE